MNSGDVTAPAGIPPHLEWKFSQVFGERTAGEEVQEGNKHSFAYYGSTLNFCVIVAILGFANSFVSAILMVD